MSTTLTEGKGERKLTFEFADRWQAFKYDESAKDNFYQNELKGNALKAVDFIASSEKCFLLMEVKYILSSDQASKLSLSRNRDKGIVDQIKNTLPKEDQEKVNVTSRHPWIVDEVIKKAKDTIIGLLASRRREDERLSAYNQSLFVNNKSVILILFLERNSELNQPESFKTTASDLKLSIEQKIRFLGNIRVLVINTLTTPPELEIAVRATERSC